MTPTFNLPPGCMGSDIEGEPMAVCESCGCEHNNDGDYCEDCQPKEESEE